MYSQEWLENPSSIRAVFIEAYYRNSSGVDTPVYLSSAGYITTDSSISFDPIVTGDISLSESLSPDNAINFSFGDIELRNPNGELDSWLDSSQRIWVNRPITIYYGDPFWSSTNLADFKTKFLKIFDGLISDIDSKGRSSISLKVVDKLQKLNGPLTEDKLGTYGKWDDSGGQSNKDTIKPLVFGEVFNIEPLLINPAVTAEQSPPDGGIEFMFNNGVSESLIEIRDNGVPLYTPGQSLIGNTVVDLNTGKFILKNSLAGTCTVSVQGVKKSIDFSGSGSLLNSYTNNIARIIGVIVTQYGKESTRLTFSEIDLTNFNSFATNNTQSVGILISDRTNILSVCQELASSVGAQLYFNRLGKLQLLKFGEATSDTLVTITDEDILHGTLAISAKLDIIAATKINYCKNWTVQNNLLTGIPEAHKAIFAEEWLSETISDSTVATNYKLEQDPEAISTSLLTTADAQAEATRRTNLFKTQKYVYRFTGTSRLLSLKLGQPVTLTHNRFNLSSGATGQVVGLTPSWLQSTVTVEVLV